MPHKYIEDKQGAVAKRLERKLWAEDRVRKYTQEAEEIRTQLLADQRVIDKLEKLDIEREAKLTEVQRTRKILALTDEGPDFDEAVLNFTRAQEEVVAIEAKMRLTYYGR